MSFILDALKKSETDRQRQSGPALFEVKVAAPRTALPPWAIAIAVVFVVNLGIVVWILMRHPAPDALPSAPAPAQTGSATPASPTQSVAAPAAVPAAASLPARADAHKPIVPASAVPSAATPTLDAARAPGAAAVPAAAAPAAANTAERANPDDYAPAAEPSAAAGGLGHVRRGTQSGVPLYQQAAAAPGNQLPQLRLDLHAYAEKARDRWVMINMHKLHEGDSLPEGVRVERITPDGAVLSYRGSQFLLSRD